jgi:hypothetical protein
VLVWCGINTKNAMTVEEKTENTLPSDERVKILALDPSVNQVGFATLQISPEGEQQWNWGSWTLDGYNLLQRCADLRAYIQQSGNDDFTHLILEWPTFYGSEKGQIAAKQNYTINLAAVAMYIAGFFRLDPDNIELVTAPQWKGSADKRITARRFFRVFGEDALQVDNHAVDAVMLLLARARKRRFIP